jgi:hypothetical protein
MKVYCPCDKDHKEFVVTVHVTEDWIVDVCGFAMIVVPKQSGRTNMTITRITEIEVIVFDGGIGTLVKYCVAVLARKWRMAFATDIIRISD